jgi:hypothetical protein
LGIIGDTVDKFERHTAHVGILWKMAMKSKNRNHQFKVTDIVGIPLPTAFTAETVAAGIPDVGSSTTGMLGHKYTRANRNLAKPVRTKYHSI